MKISGALDRAMDFAIAPGFTSFGYRVRAGGFEATPPLEGKSVLVTGASSGLGEAACSLLAEAGATVHMLVRNAEKGEDSHARISEDTGSDNLKLWTADLSEQDSIRDFTKRFIAEIGDLDALINNAGVMPSERTQTSDGIELTFATNVLGSFLLSTLLAPVLRESGAGRVIDVSSGGMYGAKLDASDPQLTNRDFDGTRFYAHTKRCEVILTEMFQEREGGADLSFHSTHPGWADTPGVAESLPAFRKVMGPFLRDPKQGADTMAWLAWADEPIRSPGRFWHDRRVRPTHRVPWTREDEEARQTLWSECQRLTKGPA